MNLKFLASFLLLCAVVLYSTKRSDKEQEQAERNFWNKERRANSVRKKSLDALNYITIPDTILNMKPLSMTEEIRDYLKDLIDLSALPIVNLTGISNTDLKLAYGTANITVLTEYDSHYTNMVTILQKLAQCLVDHNEKELATKVLEFAVSTGTDVSRTYYLLASIYQENGQKTRIRELITAASSLNTMMKDSIIQKLESILASTSSQEQL